jgi:AraC-like DNA-binding protein
MVCAVKDSIEQEKLDYWLNQDDLHQDNHTWMDEHTFLNIIKSGDVNRMRKYLRTGFPPHPVLFEGNRKKNAEYMAVAIITLAARAAIESGGTSAECFRYSDLYLKRIAACGDADDILTVRDEASLTFTQLAAKTKERNTSNRYVRDCKKIIADNLLEKISLEDIARQIGMDKTYLARLFKKSEGITVVQYIERKKIALVREMLEFSDYTIAEIAAYLSFSSQSYMGELFKRQTGVTPVQYRSLHHLPAE